MASQYTLNVSVTEHLRNFVDAQVASGHFATASEVLRAALRALERELSETTSRAAKRGSSRVVVGQRMMQAATDMFLGWTRKPIDGRHFYIRRLKDSRLADIGTRLEVSLPFYASLCGRTLARAHGRAGDPVLLSGYAGSGTALDEAISEFAVAYADQTEKDWNGFLAAIRTGRVIVTNP